jgi:hypothetical protein
VHAHWMQTSRLAERYPVNSTSHGTQRRSPCAESKQHAPTTAKPDLCTAFGNKSLHTTARAAQWIRFLPPTAEIADSSPSSHLLWPGGLYLAHCMCIIV